MDLNHFNNYRAEDFIIDEIFQEIVSKGSLSVQNLKEQLLIMTLPKD